MVCARLHQDRTVLLVPCGTVDLRFLFYKFWAVSRVVKGLVRCFERVRNQSFFFGPVDFPPFFLTHPSNPMFPKTSFPLLTVERGVR